MALARHLCAGCSWQAGAQGLAVGINYNPCVISTSARGADATVAGVNIQPNVRLSDPLWHIFFLVLLLHRV